MFLLFWGETVVNGGCRVLLARAEGAAAHGTPAPPEAPAASATWNSLNVEAIRMEPPPWPVVALAIAVDLRQGPWKRGSHLHHGHAFAAQTYQSAWLTLWTHAFLDS